MTETRLEHEQAYQRTHTVIIFYASRMEIVNSSASLSAEENRKDRLYRYYACKFIYNSPTSAYLFADPDILVVYCILL